jgi:hypothetical protein
MMNVLRNANMRSFTNMRSLTNMRSFTTNKPKKDDIWKDYTGDGCGAALNRIMLGIGFGMVLIYIDPYIKTCVDYCKNEKKE